MSTGAAPRIWDAFLTPVDREWTKLRAKRAVGFGQRCALLVIDVYRGGFGDRAEPLLASVREWPWSCGPHGWAALPQITRLLAAARAARLPIIHSTMRQSDDGLLGWMEALHGDNGGALAKGDMGRRARAKEIIEEVKPLPGEAVIAKSAPSAFWGTPLIGHLAQLRVDTVIVAGMATSGCVRASVVDGAAHRLRMMVVEDCVFDRLEASHAMSLFDIDQKYGDVVTLERALEAIASTTPERIHLREQEQGK